MQRVYAKTLQINQNGIIKKNSSDPQEGKDKKKGQTENKTKIKWPI